MEINQDGLPPLYVGLSARVRKKPVDVDFVL